MSSSGITASRDTTLLSRADLCAGCTRYLSLLEGELKCRVQKKNARLSLPAPSGATSAGSHDGENAPASASLSDPYSYLLTIFAERRNRVQGYLDQSSSIAAKWDATSDDQLRTAFQACFLPPITFPDSIHMIRDSVANYTVEQGEAERRCVRLRTLARILSKHSPSQLCTQGVLPDVHSPPNLASRLIELAELDVLGSKLAISLSTARTAFLNLILTDKTFHLPTSTHRWSRYQNPQSVSCTSDRDGDWWICEPPYTPAFAVHLALESVGVVGYCPSLEDLTGLEDHMEGSMNFWDLPSTPERSDETDQLEPNPTSLATPRSSADAFYRPHRGAKFKRWLTSPLPTYGDDDLTFEQLAGDHADDPAEASLEGVVSFLIAVRQKSASLTPRESRGELPELTARLRSLVNDSQVVDTRGNWLYRTRWDILEKIGSHGRLPMPINTTIELQDNQDKAVLSAWK